jgi:hypothetical protein
MGVFGLPRTMILDLAVALSLCGTWITAGAQCPVVVNHLSINEKAYENLQRSVNAGHEPWLLDAQAVAADYIMRMEKTPKEDWDVYALPLDPVQVEERRVVFRYSSKRRLGATYFVVVRRFKWLLPLAKNWKSMIWIPSDVKIIQCHIESNRSK